jgi:hypothetical protein
VARWRLRFIGPELAAPAGRARAEGLSLSVPDCPGDVSCGGGETAARDAAAENGTGRRRTLDLSFEVGPCPAVDFDGHAKRPAQPGDHEPTGLTRRCLQGRVELRNAPPRDVDNIAKFEPHDLRVRFYC